MNFCNTMYKKSKDILNMQYVPRGMDFCVTKCTTTTVKSWLWWELGFESRINCAFLACDFTILIPFHIAKQKRACQQSGLAEP